MFFIIFDIYELLILLIFVIKIYNVGWFYDMKNKKNGCNNWKLLDGLFINGIIVFVICFVLLVFILFCGF